MGKGNRAITEAVEARRLLATITGTAFNDGNNDGIQQTNEKWFSLDGTNAAAITIYVDLNGNGVYDAANSEPSQTLTKAGKYSINVARTGAVAIRTAYAINTATQTATAVFGMVPVVVIANIGDTLSNTNIPLRKGAVVSGTLFTDEDADGTVDTSEVKRGQANVYYDENNDGIRQNEEPFTPILAPAGTSNFKFQIPVPAGEGVLRVVRWFETDEIVIEPVTFTATVGGNITRNFAIVPEMVLNGSIFKDVDRNGKRRAAEPLVPTVRAWFDFNRNNKWDKDTEPSGLSDANGQFSILTRKTGALLGVDIRFRSTPTTLLTSTSRIDRIVFTKSQETQTYSFGIPPAAIKLQVIKDLDSSKSITAGDAPGAGVIVYIDADGDNKQDKNERSATTDANGIVTFDNLPAPKTYTLRVRYSSRFTPTTSASVLLPELDPYENANLLFGMKPI